MVTTKEIFLLSKIIDKAELADDVNKIFDNGNGKDMTETQLGMQVMISLLAKMHKAQEEIVQLVANCTEKTIEQVNAMRFKELKQALTDILKEEGVMDFLSEQAGDKSPKTLPTSSKDTDSEK